MAFLWGEGSPIAKSINKVKAPLQRMATKAGVGQDSKLSPVNKIGGWMGYSTGKGTGTGDPARGGAARPSAPPVQTGNVPVSPIVSYAQSAPPSTLPQAPQFLQQNVVTGKRYGQ
jgi:hypothetical protein